MKKAFLLLILGIFVAFSSAAQSKKFVITSKEAAQHIVPIFDVERVVVGYVLVDDTNLNLNESSYQLTFLDTQLKVLFEQELHLINKLDLWEATYNRTHYGLRFQQYSDYNSTATALVVLANDGSIFYEDIIPVHLDRYQNSAHPFTNMAYLAQTIYPVQNKGFIAYPLVVTATGKATNIKFISTVEELGSWKYEPVDEPRIQTADLFTLKGDTLYSLVQKKRRVQDIETSILVMKVSTGEYLFEKDITEDERSNISLNFQPAKQRDELTYYSLHPSRKQALNFAIRKTQINETGENEWNKQVTPFDIRGKVKKIVGGSTIFSIHNIIQTPDGKSFLIMEYPKLSSAKEMLIIEFNPEFEFKKAHLIEKQPRKMYFPDDAGGSGLYLPRTTNLGSWTQTLPHRNMHYGYLLTQYNATINHFEVAYVKNYEKKASGKKYQFGYWSLKNGTIQEGIIHGNSTANGDVYLLPAPLGKGLVAEFLKDGKEYGLRLEMKEIEY